MRKTLFVLLVIPGMLFAQMQTQAIYFTSDDDIWAAYYRGELTYEQTIELIDMYETKVDLNRGDLSRLLSIPGFETEDLRVIENLRATKGKWKNISDFERSYPGDFELIAPFVEVVEISESPISGEFYLYNYSRYMSHARGIVTIDTVDEYGEPYQIIDTMDVYYPPKNTISFTAFSKRYGKLFANFEQSGGSSMVCKRRSYELAFGQSYLILGSFNRGWGSGVLVGRYLTISSSLRNHRKTTDTSASIDKISHYYLDPRDGWMNGLYFTTRYGSFAPGVIFSHNKFSQILSVLYSGKVEYYTGKRTRFGFAYAHSELSGRAKFKSDGISGFCFVPTNLATLEAEFAFIPFTRADTAEFKNQWGLNLKTSRSKDKVKTSFNFWDYSKSYTSLYAYGLADPDYYYTELGDTMKDPYKYYNRYEGETGGEFRAELRPINELEFTGRTRYYIDRIGDASNLYTTAELSYHPPFIDEISLAYSLDVESLTVKSYFSEYYKLYSRKTLFEWLELRGLFEITTKKSSTYGYYNGTYDRLEFRFSKYKPVTLSLSFKWYDSNFEQPANGYLESTIEQGLDFYGFDFSARYDLRIYENKDEDPQHTFRFNLRYNF